MLNNIIIISEDIIIDYSLLEIQYLSQPDRAESSTIDTV